MKEFSPKCHVISINLCNPYKLVTVTLVKGLSCFHTRIGFVFSRYLLDADWSVCAGNWMWVSSSAFENVLDCTHCICPTRYAQRLDSEGKYIK